MRFLTNKEMGIVKKKKKLTAAQWARRRKKMLKTTKFRQGGDLIDQEAARLGLKKSSAS
jgi:hypothetical protein